MCGILFDLNGMVSDCEFVSALETMKHRGPDKTNAMQHGQIRAGHVRLSILDVSDMSNQPYFDTEALLIFNGEIYNFKELKNELAKFGYRFKTTGDTEVLFFALKHWGVDAFEKLNGMWGLVFVDFKSRKILVSRDRFGKKPLYFATKGRRLIIASEIKAIFKLTNEQRILDGNHLASFLCFNYWPAVDTSTLYKKIHSLPPGEIKTYDFNGREIARQNNIKLDVKSNPVLSTSERTELQKLIQNSVELRLRSDVPIGIFVSGGVDSTHIVAAASKTNANILWMTGDTGSGNDLYYAEEISKALGINLNKVEINYDDEMLQILKQMTHIYELPISLMGNSVAMNVMYKQASKKGVKVILDGTGGDELFGGYWDYHFKYVINSLFQKSQYRAVLGHTLDVVRYKHQSYSKTFQNLALTTLEYLLNSNTIARGGLFKDLKLDKQFHFQGNTKKLNLNDFLLWDIMQGRLQSWLKMNDFNSMMYSIEARSPLLDYRLLKYIKLPVSAMYRNGFNKFLLRDALPKSIPHSVKYRRDKQGFRWIQSNLLRSNKSTICHTVKKSHIISDMLGKNALNSIIDNADNQKAEQMLLRLYSVAILEESYSLDLCH